MGEAKRRAQRAAKEGNAGPGQLFTQLDINISAPGFYDDPAFQARERVDPAFLESYGRFVRDLDLPKAYLDRARRVVPGLAAALQAWMSTGDRRRACMDASLALSKMLEEVGIWNAVMRGAFSVEIDGRPDTRRYFHAFGPLDAGASVHGHTWILAPPFTVIDVAARLQPWGVPGLEESIPPVVLSDDRGGVEPTPELLFDHEALIRGGQMGMAVRVDPQVQRFMREFAGTRIAAGGVTMVYQPTAMTAPDCPFEEIGTGPGGVPMRPLWTDTIRPAIAHLL